MFIFGLTYLYEKDFNKDKIPRDIQVQFLKIQDQNNLFQLINPNVPKYVYNGPYIHENRALCSEISSLTLLVIVLSSPTNFKYRKTLRNTWANETLYKSFMNVRFVYLLGSVYDQILQDNIDREFSRYGDIIQGGFVDSYDNLTHKSAMGFRWAYERCRNAKYVIKTDDDVVLNLFKMMRNNIFSDSRDDFHIYCHRKTNEIVRKENEKWYIENEQLKGWTQYPPYCLGLFVMISNEVLPSLYELLTSAPFFLLEDALIYGFILSNIRGLKYKQVDGEEVSWVPAQKEDLSCMDNKWRDCPVFIYLLSTTHQMNKIWQKIAEIYTNS